MLGWIKEKTAFAKIAGKWYDATNLNPGDNGQISALASSLIKRTEITTQDAWLSALVNWTYNCPHPEFKFMLARGILDFLDKYRYEIEFSDSAVISAITIADKIHEAGPLA